MTRAPDGLEPEQVATREEKFSGWRALSSQEKLKLGIFAKQQALMRQKYAPGITGEDLVGEATRRAFEDGRKWRFRKISFLVFMFGIVRSIAGDLKRTAEGKLIGASISDQVLGGADEETGDPFPADPAPCLDTPENILVAKQQFAAFQSEFENPDDEEAWCILDCMAENLTGPQIQEKLGISKKTYESACRKIARRVHKFFVAN